MRGTQLPGLAGRMQRVRKQQKPVGQPRYFRRQHAGLTAAIGMAAEPDLIGMLLANFQDLLVQACAIPSSVTGTRRSVGALLPIRKIVTDYFDLMFAECAGESHQQRRIAIRSGAVS